MRTFIADKEITGDNVVHYNLPEAQQSAFESKYINRGFPTYILVDKTGKMLTNDAPRPSSGKILINKINELLLAE